MVPLLLVLLLVVVLWFGVALSFALALARATRTSRNTCDNGDGATAFGGAYTFVATDDDDDSGVPDFADQVDDMWRRRRRVAS